MDSIFQHTYKKALRECERVTDARKKCEEARANVSVVLQNVCDNWQGASGSRYEEALSEWLAYLDKMIEELKALEIQMRAEAQKVLTEWPQEAANNLLAQQQH